MSPRAYMRRLAAYGLGLVLLTALGCWALFYYQHDLVVLLMFAIGGLYAAAAWLALRKEPVLGGAARRQSLFLVIGVALAARLILLAPPPVSTDIYRYVWDGRVQAAGINPYRFKPADPQLARFQDQAIFSYINRADSAVTIYPPLAQMIFLAVTRVAENVTMMKAAMICFDMVTIASLSVLLRRRGLPQTRLLLYAWHPLPLFEFAASGHIDAAAIALMMVAMLVAERRHPVMAGMLLGGAVAVKFFPLIVAPMLYRRWDWRLPLALSVTVALLYVPYLGVGWHVLGFLPGYAQDEGLVHGGGFFLLGVLQSLTPLAGWMVPAYLVMAAAILAAIALPYVLRRSTDEISMQAVLFMLAAFTLLISPHLAWYFAWMIPFFCGCARPAWALIYLTIAAPLLYANLWTSDAITLQSLMYVPFVILCSIEWYFRFRRSHLEFTDDRQLKPRPAR